MKAQKKENYTAITNACKLCSPLGASLVFRGLKRSIPLLHGSQGCSTYIRRYLISHFNEPVDIACSNFTEETAVFGGGANLKLALDNIIAQYKPDIIGIATTCLSETIGDDLPLILANYNNEKWAHEAPAIIPVSTPSYSGTHMDGFHLSLIAAVETLVKKKGAIGEQINLFPGMLSPADYRHLKEIISDFGLDLIMLPDYSQTLDGPLWSEYQKIPEGGTALKGIKSMGTACGSIEFGRVLSWQDSAGKLLQDRVDVPCHSLGLPIGIKETDRFFKVLECLSGRSMPEKYKEERGRLLDSYADGHKYVFEARAVVYGEEDLVIGMASFLHEIGIIPVICASGGKSGYMQREIFKMIPEAASLGIKVLSGVDFELMAKEARKADPDFLIGNSKGYKLACEIKKPLIRIGFPVHDRLGGARIVHAGYRGAQQLFDIISNLIIGKKQDSSPVGYTYM